MFATAHRSGRRYETGEALRFCCLMCWLQASPPSTRVLTACDAVGGGRGRRCRRRRRHLKRNVAATAPVVHEAVCANLKLSARWLRRCLRHFRRRRNRCRRRRHNNQQERPLTARGAVRGSGGRSCRLFRHQQGRHRRQPCPPHLSRISLHFGCISQTIAFSEASHDRPAHGVICESRCMDSFQSNVMRLTGCGGGMYNLIHVFPTFSCLNGSLILVLPSAGYPVTDGAYRHVLSLGKSCGHLTWAAFQAGHLTA